MINTFLLLVVSIVQLYLVQYIFSRIHFTEGEKLKEKTALKEYLHGFLVYIIGFGAVLNLFQQTLGFPKEFNIPLFSIGFALFTFVWITENRALLLENVKGTFLYRLLKGEVNRVKENMYIDESVLEMRSKYPFHTSEPMSKASGERVQSNDYELQTKSETAKMVLERSN